ncbi:MAG: CHAT domain-containing protein [Parasphingorhabdus sp.]
MSQRGNRSFFSLGKFTATLVGIVLYVSAGPAIAATPQELCGRSSPNESLATALDSDLRQATEAAEKTLSGSNSDLLLGDKALEQLVVSNDVNAEISSSTLAAYCSAAGEAMRIARSGSGRRARTYLLTALNAAEKANTINVQSQIAYRLALVSRNLTVRPNTRSARRSISETVQPLEIPTDDVVANNQCSTLLRANLDNESNWAASKLALECAFFSADGQTADETKALAQLQIGRITLAESERRPATREKLRKQAGDAALIGLLVANNITNRAKRFDMMSRLAETAIDAGFANKQPITDNLATLRETFSGDPGEQALVYALHGRVMLTSGRIEQAAALFRRAIFFESQKPQPLRIADWYLLLAGADKSDEQKHVMQAYRALEAIRPLLPAIDPITEESIFKLRMQPVFSAAVDVQLSQPSTGLEAGGILAAQQIVESFRQAEIQYVFGADCVPPRIPVSPTDLKDGEILLYPILLEDRVELLYAAKVKGGAPPVYKRFTQDKNADNETIARLVKKAAFELGYGEDDSWEQPAIELYRLLIEPIEGLLGAETTLVIVPDGILRRLPFAALKDADGNLLIEKTRISIAPSLAYTQPGTKLNKNAGVVAASLSKAVDLPAGSFIALNGTSSEAKMASGLGDASNPVGVHLDNFSRAQLQTAFAGQPIDILHLATHASFNGRSDRSFIVAEDQAILLSELRDIISGNRASGELLSLIVLSACETALGDDQASMGLAGSAVQAGAESALASLWEVDDVGTAALMEEFYRNYAKGQGKAEALRNAQLALIGDGSNFSDPRIWAAFTLLGAWR